MTDLEDRKHASSNSEMFPMSKNIEKSLAALEQDAAPGKAFGSMGWLFLINDSNRFLSYQFGSSRWSDADLHAVHDLFEERTMKLKRIGAKYYKFIVPEKSVVYKEYLIDRIDCPTVFSRPAIQMAQLSECVSYLNKSLCDAKPISQVYFRGDTHPTWFGGWSIYRAIHNRIYRDFPSIGPALSLSKLHPNIALYDGDLFTHISQSEVDRFRTANRDTTQKDALEVVVQLRLRDQDRNFNYVDIEDEFKLLFSRPYFATEHQDKKLPRAVVIRDSTADFVIDLLAEHFSRAVFYWKEGLVLNEIIEREKPDVVIHIMAERFVSSYPYLSPIASLKNCEPPMPEVI